jgi:hypothetical protein
MDKIDTILSCLVGNVEDFKRRCEAKITSSNIVKDLHEALEAGNQLMGNIETVMDRLSEISERLEERDDTF